jgi:hypothetical protein
MGTLCARRETWRETWREAWRENGNDDSILPLASLFFV